MAKDLRHGRPDNGRSKPKTVGSLFAGIGGFDLGFERAGWRTKWQVEIDPTSRAVLAARFPKAKRFEDVRKCGEKNLEKVDCITAGFPCQDFSAAGQRTKRRGLDGERSGLFWEALRIAREIRPTWLVFENVTGLLALNNGKDFVAIIRALAEGGYLGCWRVLNAQYFGVPQNRRRVFLVGGFGRIPPAEFIFDAAPVEAIPSASAKITIPRGPQSFAANTLTAGTAASQIGLGHEVLVAEENGWRSMVERERMSRVHGIPAGVDGRDFARRHAAGNAVVPAMAKWIAEILGRA